MQSSTYEATPTDIHIQSYYLNAPRFLGFLGFSITCSLLYHTYINIYIISYKTILRISGFHTLRTSYGAQLKIIFLLGDYVRRVIFLVFWLNLIKFPYYWKFINNIY